MITRKITVDKRLKSMDYWMQYLKEFDPRHPRRHVLTMNTIPLMKPPQALYKGWNPSWLGNTEYLVEMIVTEKLLTGYFVEPNVLKDWLRLSDVYLHQKITPEARRLKLSQTVLDIALYVLGCLFAADIQVRWHINDIVQAVLLHRLINSSACVSCCQLQTKGETTGCIISCKRIQVQSQ
eukprot:650539_1